MSPRVLVMLLLALSSVLPSFAHDLQISDVRVSDPERDGARRIIFDIRWDDSWRGVLNADGRENWDAAWVFVKFQSPRDGRWLHATIAEDGHVAPPEAVIEPAEHGVFVYRRGPSCNIETKAGDIEVCKGRAEFKEVQIRWSNPPETVVDLWVMGIEMVLVPSGPFLVGDDRCESDSSRCFYTTGTNSTEMDHYKVTDETSEIPLCAGEDGRAEGQGLCYRRSGSSPTPESILPEFPKGFHRFYGMKYELTQGQYADFINSLPRQARTFRFPYGAQGTFRNETQWDRVGSGLRVARRPERANNWVSWSDASAYLDWAALRPMTELEFEKMARGPNEPQAGEYAWGNTNIRPATIIVGSEDHGITINGNCHIGGRDNGREHFLIGGDTGFGPLRGDAFVRSSSNFMDVIERPGHLSTAAEVGAGEREQEGRSYYGAMHLSGNLWEYVVSVSRGGFFTGKHGDGQLAGAGGKCDRDRENCFVSPNVENWPREDGGGIGFRGGAWFTERARARIADRAKIDAFYPFRSHDVGIRGVRTAPDPGQR